MDVEKIDSESNSKIHGSKAPIGIRNMILMGDQVVIRTFFPEVSWTKLGVGGTAPYSKNAMPCCFICGVDVYASISKPNHCHAGSSR